jgi:hypothetical protein
MAGVVKDDPVRARLRALAEARGESWSLLSHVIGRNATYIERYIQRGTPRRLPEGERLLLAMHFGVDERQLGARDPWVPVTVGKELSH